MADLWAGGQAGAAAHVSSPLEGDPRLRATVLARVEKQLHGMLSHLKGSGMGAAWYVAPPVGGSEGRADYRRHDGHDGQRSMRQVVKALPKPFLLDEQVG